MSYGGAGDGGSNNGNYPNDNGGGSWTGVVLTLILSLLIAITLVVLLYLAAWCLLKRSTARRRSRINQLINEATINRTHPQEPPNSGLNQLAIDSLPVFAYKQLILLLNNQHEDYKNGGSRECAVCLSLFQDEEMIKLLQNCKHFFHVDCINVWLRSNTTCPICRCNTTTQPPALLPEPPELPSHHHDMDSVVVVPPLLLAHPVVILSESS
ncbi:RING-H2 finger protein ATL40-like [Telopea speciosissima]|uniref:RING-H2 finger protein ATL40-like n=1 Tax=Telopea speciosissima TaxID=54955 RepID=UPI001CC4564F|nr:RING-H2 finger protein ATL40-like [Telopea speciosissima]